VDELTGEVWGAVAVPVVALALGVAVAHAGTPAVLGGAPLLLLLTTRFSLHTKQALALACLSIAATLALARLSARRGA
jgi:hypothetical protein